MCSGSLDIGSVIHDCLGKVMTSFSILLEDGEPLDLQPHLHKLVCVSAWEDAKLSAQEESTGALLTHP